MRVFPIFDYSDVAYRSTLKTLLHNLSVIYHAAICFVTELAFIPFLQINSLVSVHLRNFHWENAVIFTVNSKHSQYKSHSMFQ